MLINSAIKVNDKIYTGRRHSHIIQSDYNVDFKQGIQGFVDENGKFYTRDEAKTYAFEIGQITKTISEILTSEDLW
jgi:hypothetical protein